MRIVDIIAVVLLIIGGLNWGLVGLFDFNLVTVVFGTLPVLVKLIYILVGVAALYQIFRFNEILHHSN
jgi:uncharacterized protein